MNMELKYNCYTYMTQQKERSLCMVNSNRNNQIPKPFKNK